MIDLHEFDGVSVGSLTHMQKLARHCAPCVMWLEDLDLLFPQQHDVVSGGITEERRRRARKGRKELAS